MGGWGDERRRGWEDKFVTAVWMAKLNCLNINAQPLLSHLPANSEKL